MERRITKKNEIGRQGDVWFQKVSGFPKGKRTPVEKDAERKAVVLAYGEVTGHCHQIVDEIGNKAELFEVVGDLGIEKYLEIKEEARLVHEEHEAFTFDPGVYKIWYHREYSPEEIKRVQD